ncbi:MAG: choice-of-anchor N protein, partial [candidate division Zixibacteria bacterium]|nr:choice-of-anchor N protein [candidate division Zixibacteria bacterium]
YDHTDFEVWVIAANLDKGAIYDVTLVAALMGETPVDGALEITLHRDDPLSDTTKIFNTDDYTLGTPPTNPDVADIGPHGVYPTNYVEFLAASVTTSNPYPVQNYVPYDEEGTSLYGQIFKFNVTTTYDIVHFDAFGFYEDVDGSLINAPFSHDGETSVPEPATLLLFGIGLGAGYLRKKFK